MPRTVLLLVTLCTPSATFAEDWKPVHGEYPPTRWAKDVTPDRVLCHRALDTAAQLMSNGFQA